MSTPNNEHGFYSARPPGSVASRNENVRHYKTVSAQKSTFGGLPSISSRQCVVPLPRHPNATVDNYISKTVPKGSFSGHGTQTSGTTDKENAGPGKRTNLRTCHTLPAFSSADGEESSFMERERSYNSISTRGLIQNCAAEPSYSNTLRKTIDPCSEVPVRPHKAPCPAESYHPPQRPLQSLFGGQFSQFLEDRMLQFRPSVSQNNVDAPLEMSHPYQNAPTLRDSEVAERIVDAATYPRCQGAARDASELVDMAPTFPSMLRFPANNDNSFLPKGFRANINEPESSLMSYTPRAVPLAEAKEVHYQPVEYTCSCFQWPF